MTHGFDFDPPKFANEMELTRRERVGMSDRETLEAALAPRLIAPGLLPVYEAARERLAQLPEKCEHGWSVPHTPTPVRVAGGVSADEWCPGKVYPAETVETIAETICRIDNDTGPDMAVEGIPCALHRSVAVAVLDALGETP